MKTSEIRQDFRAGELQHMEANHKHVFWYFWSSNQDLTFAEALRVYEIAVDAGRAEARKIRHGKCVTHPTKLRHC